jgi:hypothetical protein
MPWAQWPLAISQRAQHASQRRMHVGTQQMPPVTHRWKANTLEMGDHVLGDGRGRPWPAMGVAR